MSEVITNENGIGFIKDYTPNLKLAIPYFDIATWHDYIDYNFKALDAVINYIYKIVGFTGEWKNVTTYKVDDIVFINDKNSQYYLKLAKVIVEHTTNSDNFDIFYSNHEEYYEIFNEHILTNGIKIVKINQTLTLSAKQLIQIDLTSYTNENKSYYCIINFNQQTDITKIPNTCSYNKTTRLVTVENYNNNQSSVIIDFIMLIPIDKLVGFDNEINGLTNGLYQTDNLVKNSELVEEINNRTTGDNNILSYINELLTTIQTKIDNNNKLSSDLVDDTNNTNKFVTILEKETWNNKQNIIDSTNKLNSDLIDDSNSTNKFISEDDRNKIDNSIQKSGDTMIGSLETPEIITNALFVRKDSLTSVAILSASIENSQVYFGNVNFTTYLRGSALKYMDPTGTNYDVRTSQGFIQGNGSWTWQFDDEIKKYYAQVELSSNIPYTGKKYLILFHTLRADFWKYINTYGYFVNSSLRRRLIIYFDQQLYTDLSTSNPTVEFTAIPLDSSFTRDYAIFTPTSYDVSDEWWNNDDYPSNTYPQKAIDKLLITKQDTLVSGTSIKTINGNSLLGSGDIVISGGGTSYTAGTGIIIQNDEISVDGEQSQTLDTETVSELDASTFQTVANLVKSVSSESTDEQYPSAKLFYDTCGDIETLINNL